MKKYVAVVYPFVPHYRKPIFDEFSSSSAEFDYTVFADTVGADKTIKASSEGGRFHFVRTPVSYFSTFLWQFGLLGPVLGSKYRIFVFLGNPYYISTWVYAIVARLLNKKVFFWTHGWLRKDGFLKGLFRNYFYRLSNGLLLYGERAKSIGLEHGFSSSRLHVIYNSLDYESQCAVRDKIKLGGGEAVDQFRDGSLYFACIARLTPECSFDIAIEALASLERQHGLRVPLVLIGDGPERGALEQQSKELGVDVRFCGAMYDERDIGPVLYHARAVVSPGKVGLTAIHSLTYGTPVITHGDAALQGPEVEAIQDGVSGSFFDRNSVSELTSAMLFWANKKRDDTERAMCEAAVEGKYTPSDQLRLIEKALAG